MVKLVNPLQSTEARGKLGGTVYNTWRGIRYAKTHTPPSNQSAPLRQEAKQRVINAAQRWKTITSSQRSEWNNYANEHTLDDWTGSPKRIAGFHWYVKINTIVQYIGEPYQDDPPQAIPIERPESWILTQSGGDIIAMWTWPAEGNPNDYHVQWWMSRPQSPGIGIRTPDLYIATVAPATDYIVGWQHSGPGYYIIGVRSIHKTGQTSILARDSITIT